MQLTGCKKIEWALKAVRIAAAVNPDSGSHAAVNENFHK